MLVGKQHLKVVINSFCLKYPSLTSMSTLQTIKSFQTVKEHFGILFMLSNIPAGAANFVVDPIYQNLILNGDNLADANFKEGK